jgi:hypothetical protein
METFKFWARPAVVAGLWIAATSFTLSELSTVVPSLRAASAPGPRVRDAKQQPVVRARAQQSSRLSVVP